MAVAVLPTGIVVEPIGKNVPVQEVYPTFKERYFSPRYQINAANKDSEDICILFHSNGICIITLAPSHPIVKNKKTVTSINFQVSDKLNRLENNVKGKGKHGAQFLNENSVLCIVQCDDDTSYSIRSCILAKLMEINSSLVDNPQLLVDKPDTDGYIAIALPHKDKCELQKNKLTSHEDYLKSVSERENS